MTTQSTPKQPNRQQLRHFGLLLGALLPLIFSVIMPVLHRHPAPLWPAIIGMALALTGLLAPQMLHLPYKGWMALGHVLGVVNSHLILGLVYVVVMQPIALVMRCLGHDPLRKRWDTKRSSYREETKGRRTNLKQPF